jgi:PAS domain S-box-containing protein
MPREIVDPIIEAIHGALRERKTVTVEFAREAGGHTEWHSAAISPFSDTAIVAVVRDITERVVARQELELQRDALQQEVIERQAAQEELRALFAAMTDRVIVFDRGGRVVRLPDTNAPDLGIAREELPGMKLRDIVPLDQADRVLQTIQRALSERVTVTEELAYVFDENTYWFSTAFSPISDDEVVMVARDITEVVNARTQIERQVEERTRELRALLDVSSNVASTLELEPLLNLVIEQVGWVVDHWRASLFLVREGGLMMVGSRVKGDPEASGSGARVLTFEEIAPVWRELSAGRPVIIENVRDRSEMAQVYQRVASGRAPDPGGRTRSNLAVPLVYKDRTIGMLTVAHEQPAYYTTEHANLLMAIASQAAIAVENARLYEQVQARSQELQTLLNVSRNVASTLELRPLLELIIDQLKQIVDFSRCSIFELEGETMVILDSRANFTDMPLDMRFQVGELGPIWERMSRGESVVVDDVHDESAFAQAYRHAAGARMQTYAFQAIHSALGVPLTSKDRIIGMLVLTHLQPAYYNERHAGLVSAIATQIAVAIDNARLYEQAQQLAAVEERQRLARELHDSVSQALYGIALGARTARTLLDRDPAKVIEPVEYVLSLAEAGLAEMRALIFELRPESLEIEGLVAALDKQVAATAARYGIEVTSDLIEEPEMSLAQKEIFYRIGQEALHNVVKHARASKASVRLARDNGSFVLEVTDNGVGFEAGQSFPGHMGLVSMSERAQSIGAALQVESAPGKGTKVKLRARPGSVSTPEG